MKNTKKSAFLLVAGLMISTVACSSAVANQLQQGGAKKGGPPSVDEIFKTMDANKDGLLAKSELKGPLAEMFDKIDVDFDGFISREELENAPKPERGQRPPKAY